MKRFLSAFPRVVFILFILLETTLAEEYIIKNYNIHDGLVQSAVRSLYQDSTGFLWIGAINGLSCFDGRRFYNFREPYDLFSSQISTIARSPEGNLLLLNKEGEIWQFDGTEFSRYKITLPSTGVKINDFIVYEKGLLIGTQNHGCFYIIGENVFHYNSEGGLYHNRVRDISRDSYGIYIISDGGVNEFKDGAVFPLFPNENYNITAIIRHSGGEYWAGFQNEGIFRQKDKTWEKMFSIPGVYINGFAENKNTAIWFSSNFGLRRIVENSLGEVYIFDEINTLLVRNVIIDKENNIWCGSYGKGLYKLSESFFFNFTVENGFSSYYGKVLLHDSRDRVWVSAATRGCAAFSCEGAKFFNASTGYSFINVTGAAEIPSGDIIIAADNSLYKYSDSGMSLYNTENPGGGILDVFTDSQGTLWMGKRNDGAVKLCDDKWERFSYLPDKISVTYIYEDHSGDMWFAAYNDGLYCYNGKEIIHYSVSNGLGSDIVNSVLDVSGSGIWIATKRGVNILNENGITDTLDINDGLPGNIINSLGYYDGKVLIGTSDGLAVWDNRDINFFTAREDLPGNDISDAIIPVDNFGKAWFGSTGGVSAFKINQYLEKDYFHRAYFNKIYTEKDTLRFNLIKTGDETDSLTFSSARDFIRFEFNTISFSKEISWYRYKLVSVNENSKWQYSKENIISVDDPKSGSYRMVIETRSFGEDWKPAYDLILVITDPFYKTNAFFIFTGGVILLFSAGYYYSRKKQKIKNKYKTSSLNKADIDEIMEKIKFVIEGQKQYKNSGFTLKQLSEVLSFPREHLSQVINTRMGKNYNDYINSRRINEAKTLLEKNGSLNMQIIQIAYEVGFNSKSSFNTAFKKFTGKTPSEYKRQFTGQG